MTNSTVTAAAGILAASLAASAAEAETLIVSSGLSPTHVVTTHGFEPWMACVTEATNDAIDFNFFPSGQIASVKDSLDALNNGLANVAFVSPSNESSRLPLNGIPMLPGMGDSSAEMVAAYRKALDSGGAMAAELTANNIRPIVVNALPAYQIMSAGAPVDTLEKWQGRKVRVAGGAMSFTVTSLGGSPVEMPAGDMYTAMQRGTVDSTILALASVKTYSMQELVKSMSSNGSFGTSAQMFAIDAGVWDRLSPEHQKAITACGQKVETELAAHLDAENEALKAEFAAAGITVYEFPQDARTAIAERLKNVANDYIARLEARGLPAQETYDAYLVALGE